MPGKVLVFGSINTDLVTYVEKLPHPGETITGGNFNIYPGGKGANQAVAAVKSGADVNFFSCLGDDSFGRERLSSLSAAGVSTKNIVVIKGAHSGIAQIIVDSEGENLIAVAPGANRYMKPELFRIPDPQQNQCLIALFQNEIPIETTQGLITECKKRGMSIIWNFAPPIDSSLSKEIIPYADYLIVNYWFTRP